MLFAYLGLLLFTATPACQRWLAAKASDVLSDELKTEVKLGNARLGLFNRLVLDDVLLLDQQNDTLLSAVRLSAKMDVWQLMQGRIRIDNVQLFGYDVRLRRHAPDQPYNFQFILDRFASQDTTHTPLDLAISSIVVRRGSLSHELTYEPTTPHFSIAHLRLDSLRLKASINALTDSSASIKINELSFTESFSRLRLDDISLAAEATPTRIYVSPLNVRLPNSEINCRLTATTRAKEPWKFIEGGRAAMHLEGFVTPSDLAPFVPSLQTLNRRINVKTELTRYNQQLNLNHLAVDADGLTLNCKAKAHLNTSDTTLVVPLDDLHLDLQQFAADQSFYQPILQLLAQSGNKAPLKPETAELIARLGDVRVAGTLEGRHKPRSSAADLVVQTAIGNAKVKGQLTASDLFELHAETEDILLATLLQQEDFPVNNLTVVADVEGSVRARTAQGQVKATDLTIKGERLDVFVADVQLSRRQLKMIAALDDDNYEFDITTDLQSHVDVRLNKDLLEHLNGFVDIHDVGVHNSKQYYDLQSLRLAFNNDDHGHHFIARGDFIDAHADGHFHYADLATTMQQLLHGALPSLIKAPKASSQETDDQLNFSVNVWDIAPLQQFIQSDIDLPEPGYIEGSIDGPAKRFSLQADLPHFVYGAQDLRAVSLLARQDGDSLMTFVTLQRMMENGPLDLTFDAGARNDRLSTVITWDDHNLPSQRGALSTTAKFLRDNAHKLGADITFHPTQVVVSDTVWNVHESQVNLHDGIVDVNGFQISQLGRHLQVDGRVSRQPTDTLYADLRGINLQYVFGLIDFHDVEFSGLATGKVKAHGLFDDIAVDADLRVDQFTLNDGLLGQLYVTGGFGRKDERAIDLDAFIHEPLEGQISHVTALIKPGHEPGRGMELDVQARHLNTYFINEFTNSFFTDLQGQATGHAHLYGPFKQLDLEGDLVLDTMAVTIDVLGTRYHLNGGDSVHLRPGSISFNNIQVYDRYHGHDNRQHRGVLNGAVEFEHFKNLRYNFQVEAHDILGYDFHDFGDQTFYGTVFADGNVKLNGYPGTLNVDLQCRPTAGTVFTYNASSPETMTENQFITFKKEETTAVDSPTALSIREGAVTFKGEKIQGSQDSAPSLQGRAGGESSESSTSSGGKSSSSSSSDEEENDMRINFDLDITPVAQMRLLMDPRSEDYITLFGNGHIRANFYNKGRFQMYGTYRVDHGTYRLSLQDVIRKDFQFQQGSSIVFGGQPMKADLNLQAVYTVPSVSLNDLTVGSNFSSTNVRVNCLMNIGGRAEQPQVSFDFDIPNVNEDEKQMVRSLISTDEERNMQVIYLLGIGRFYTYGLAADQSQANAAVQSLLSSTLSGQLNNFLSNAIGNGNWNFGTNLSTGNQGWNEVDVEGMLSGRLLNNRLLINGTFGYRDTPIANTNFIGDFDVQWLLTPSGNLSLKAYSETNDRYFTKTALTTQGIGIQVKKDFNSLGELFRPRRRTTAPKK